MSFEIDVIVEIPVGSKFKYEVNKKTGKLAVDRPLSIRIPCNYGFIPNTLHEDGDPLDVWLLGSEPIYPLTEVKAIIVGALKCIDNGVSDHKILAIVVGDTANVDVGNSTDVEFITHYLSNYKEGFVVESLVNKEEAYAILMKDVEAYLNG